MDLTVIVATYNRASFLRQMLNTLMAQSLDEPIQWEVLVLDNNSTDGTRAVVEEFARHSPVPIRYSFEGRQGKSYALNRGIREASGDILAFTDDDVLLDKRWISELWWMTRRFPHECFGGRVLPLWPDKAPAWVTLDKPFRLIGGPIVAHDWGDECREYDSTMYAPIGANLVVHRKVLLEHGGFNPSYRRCEDSELCFRLMHAGVKCMYVPTPLVWHPVEPERMQGPYLRRWFFTAGKGNAKLVADARLRSANRDRMSMVFGVPRYLIRKLVEAVCRWSLCADPTLRMFRHLQVCYTAGEIAAWFQANSHKNGAEEQTMTGPTPGPPGRASQSAA